MSKKRTIAPIGLAAVGIFLSLIALEPGEADGQLAHANAASTMPFRAIVPQLANDQGRSPTTQTTSPTPTRTPTPTVPAGGGGCIASRTTLEWRLCVTYPTFPGNLFDIIVTPLTEDAAEGAFKVRVYHPNNFIGDDSLTKRPFYAGQQIRLYYPDYDFLLFDDELPPGMYEVELRVDFHRESSVSVFVN